MRSKILFVCISIFMTSAAAASNFLTLADFHFDPYTPCYNVNKLPCAFILKLEKLPVSAWPNAFAAQPANNLTKMGSDANAYLLASALAAARAAALRENPQFIVILGDFLRHHNRDTFKYYTKDKNQQRYQAFTYKIFQYLNQQLQDAFPHKTILPLIGNNDSYLGDYYTEANASFFHDVNSLWLQLIHPLPAQHMDNQLTHAGYYAINDPHNINIRLIFLNTVPFSYKAKGKHSGAIAQQELQWLHQELLRAKKLHQYVYIFMHIPPSIEVYITLHTRLFTLFDLWKKEYSISFYHELYSFQPQIAAVFAAHLHSNWYHVIDLQGRKLLFSGTPSISPIFGNRPAFKFYNFNDNNAAIESFTLDAMQSHSDNWKEKALQLYVNR